MLLEDGEPLTCTDDQQSVPADGITTLTTDPPTLITAGTSRVRSPRPRLARPGFKG